MRRCFGTKCWDLIGIVFEALTGDVLHDMRYSMGCGAPSWFSNPISICSWRWAWLPSLQCGCIWVVSFPTATTSVASVASCFGDKTACVCVCTKPGRGQVITRCVVDEGPGAGEPPQTFLATPRVAQHMHGAICCWGKQGALLIPCGDNCCGVGGIQYCSSYGQKRAFR